jgi:DNA-binding CsgD family transcriptional regulator
MTWTCPKCGAVHPEAGLLMLSPMERRVLQQFVNGHTPMKVAAKLGISYHTVRTHQNSIYAKLGVQSAVVAVVYAIRHGMTPEEVTP